MLSLDDSADREHDGPMSTATKTIVDAIKPLVVKSGFASVPDFCFSAAVIAATYSDDTTEDGVWGAILATSDVDADVVIAAQTEADEVDGVYRVRGDQGEVRVWAMVEQRDLADLF